MSPVDLTILIFFGGIMLVSFFLLVSAGRLALREYRDPAREPLRQNRFFVITTSIAISAMGLMGVSWVRVQDGLEGHELGGSSPVTLMVSLLLLWAAKTGFHWAASIGRSRVMWRLYVALVFIWAAGAILFL
jgi:hypothetical protein